MLFQNEPELPERFLLAGGTRDRTAQKGRELEIKTVQTH